MEAEEAVFYYTMGLSGGNPRSEQIYAYSKAGYTRFTGHPDEGEFILVKKSFEIWVADCLNGIILESKEAKSYINFPGRSLNARKPRFL